MLGTLRVLYTTKSKKNQGGLSICLKKNFLTFYFFFWSQVNSTLMSDTLVPVRPAGAKELNLILEGGGSLIFLYLPQT